MIEFKKETKIMRVVLKLINIKFVFTYLGIYVMIKFSKTCRYNFNVLYNHSLQFKRTDNPNLISMTLNDLDKGFPSKLETGRPSGCIILI